MEITLLWFKLEGKKVWHRTKFETFFHISLFHSVLLHFFCPLWNYFFLVLDNFFLPLGPKGKYNLKLNASLPMVNALHTTVHTTQYVHNIRPKGGLMSEDILALVPFPTKGAKSFSWAENLNFTPKTLNNFFKIFAQDSDFAPFVGNETKVKISSEIKPSLSRKVARTPRLHDASILLWNANSIGILLPKLFGPAVRKKLF